MQARSSTMAHHKIHETSKSSSRKLIIDEPIRNPVTVFSDDGQNPNDSVTNLSNEPNDLDLSSTLNDNAKIDEVSQCKIHSVNCEVSINPSPDADHSRDESSANLNDLPDDQLPAHTCYKDAIIKQVIHFNSNGYMLTAHSSVFLYRFRADFCLVCILRRIEYIHFSFGDSLLFLFLYMGFVNMFIIVMIFIMVWCESKSKKEYELREIHSRLLQPSI